MLALYHLNKPLSLSLSLSTESTESKEDDKESLYKNWKYLKTKTDEKSKAELEEVEKILAEKYAKENFEKIKQRVGNIDSEDGGLNVGSLWSLKKELFPQARDPPPQL